MKIDYLEIPEESNGKVCEYCGNTINSKDKRQKFCNEKCYHSSKTGKNHPNWKGGIKHRPDGYIRNSKNDKYIHRETMENYLGRKLNNNEHIHHINGNKSDNKIENLEIHTNSSHRKLEVKKEKRNKLGRFSK
jgi:hypothetical protein